MLTNLIFITRMYPSINEFLLLLFRQYCIMFGGRESKCAILKSLEKISHEFFLISSYPPLTTYTISDERSVRVDYFAGEQLD